MKPAIFDYERPKTLADAISLLARHDGDAKVIAGGQSLGPMLNMRLAQPKLLIDVARLPELKRIEDGKEAVTVGAAITHAEIEDGKAPDPTRGALRAVAADIAYRAVRNRGTIGGSLAHADPSADWLTALSAMHAEASIASPKGTRRVPVATLAVSAFETVLGAGEIIDAVRIPRFSDAARWGFYKFCRKTGEYAEGMCAILIDPARGIARAVLGATHAKPIVVDGIDGLSSGGFDSARAGKIVDENGLGHDPFERQIHVAALRRAVAQVTARVSP